jgi:dihydropteroate synthase
LGETRHLQLQIKDQTYDLGQRTWLMGVVNVTPDSFYDGGLYFEPARAIEHALKLVGDGADIIDVGGESSRPGAGPVSAREERKRVLPVIEVVREKKNVLISVDTAKAEVAEAALAEGAHLVNDISAGRFDPDLLPLISRTGAGLILMHMKGTPRTMQGLARYEDVLAEVKAFLAGRLAAAGEAGVSPAAMICDPGIGFAKTLEHNLALINGLPELAGLGRPLLVGLSRKSFIGQILGAEPGDRLEGTIAAAVVSALNGASILRVHDVLEVRRALAVAEAIVGRGPGRLAPEALGKPYVH